MNNNLQILLGELYDIDPDLKKHEKELVPIIEKFLKAKPNAEPSGAFVEELRTMLKQEVTGTEKLRATGYGLRAFPHWLYTLSGLTAGLLIAAIGFNMLPQSTTFVDEQTGSTTLFSYSVKDAAPNAFGSLDGVAANKEMFTSGRNQSGGGGGNPLALGAPAAISGSDSMLTAPAYQIYTFELSDQMPALGAGQMEVYKRIKDGRGIDASALLRTINVGSIDVNTFPNAKADSISFYQDTQYGYMYSINFREGMVNINQHWEKWPHPEAECRDEVCYERFRMQPSDMLQDEDLINIAQTFLMEHRVDMSQYGEPTIDNMWRVQYEAMTDKRFAYVPDIGRVIFPLMIDGRPVYDEGGNPSGISVGVSVREKRVSDVNGISDLAFERSLYDSVDTASAITSYLQNLGGNRSWIPEGAETSNIIVRLGTPTQAMIRFYQYENGSNDELIAPALVFPVENVSDGSQYYTRSIVVPLVSDLLTLMQDRLGGGGGVLPIEPMPVEPVPLPTPLMNEESGEGGN